ncbi:MAG: helix-turn-helix transcriptional regulator [Spirochaetes bacterium]|nr:helix-turn-helix transcriptional regulator [Spirochaetota bacterium]MBN2770263.1 helix-turn-helix transcriptional regulator [Spirochaetota bacterium]
MKNKYKDEVALFFEELTKEDKAYYTYKKIWGPLASFLTDYEHLKGLNGLTQENIAQKAGTTQSAISRFERMKGKPAYELLRKISEAAGGELFITPLANVSLTLPYDLHDMVLERAEQENKTVQKFVSDIVRRELETSVYEETVEIQDMPSLSDSISATEYQKPTLAIISDGDDGLLGLAS